MHDERSRARDSLLRPYKFNAHPQRLERAQNKAIVSAKPEHRAAGLLFSDIAADFLDVRDGLAWDNEGADHFLATKSESARIRGRLQMIFVKGFTRQAVIAWSFVIPGVRTAFLRGLY